MSTQYDELYREFALSLFNIGAVKLDKVGFRLKLHETNPNAPLSPIFFNLRDADNPKPGPMTPWAYRTAAALLDELVDRVEIEFDYFASIPNAGDPFVDALVELNPSRWSEERRIKLHKQLNADGTRRIDQIVDGTIEPGSRVLLIDDLITEADTKLEAVKVLRDAGLIVEHLLVLIDRCQGGSDTMAASGVATHSVYQLPILLVGYVEAGLIDQALATKVLDYLQG